MTTFEKELRKLFDHDAVFTDARFIGRTCYGRISDKLRVRAEFITLGCTDICAALKVSLINRYEGEVDSSILRFREIMGIKQVSNPNFQDGISPHMWVYQGKLEWYSYKPTSEDYEKLADTVDSYLEVFREPVQEINHEMELKMG